MQQSIGIKQFMVNHVVATALACGVLVSGVLGVAGLSATGNLPRSVNSNGPSVVTRADQVAQTGAQKEARLVAAEAQASGYAARAAEVAQVQRATAHKEASMDAELAAITSQPTQVQRVAVDKATWLDVRTQRHAEFAARQEIMHRYYTHKEAQLDALP